jgi:hypothetical protein
MASREARLQALEAAARQKRGARFPRALVIYGTAEIEAAKNDGRSILLIHGTTLALDVSLHKVVDPTDAAFGGGLPYDRSPMR